MKIILKTFAASGVKSMKKSKVKPGDVFKLYNEKGELMGSVDFHEYQSNKMDMKTGEFPEYYRFYITSPPTYSKDIKAVGSWLYDNTDFKEVGRDTAEKRDLYIKTGGKKYPWTSESIEDMQETLFAVLTMVENAGGKVEAPKNFSKNFAKSLDSYKGKTYLSGNCWIKIIKMHEVDGEDDFICDAETYVEHQDGTWSHTPIEKDWEVNVDGSVSASEWKYAVNGYKTNPRKK
jgi:hypothetical protein